MKTLDDHKYAVLHALSVILNWRFMRGRITISDLIYRWLKPAGRIVDQQVGRYKISLDISDNELRYIYFGAFEPDERKFLTSFLRRGDVFVDVGANVGYLSAVALNKIGEQGRVYAFEPSPRNFELLQTLVRSSGGSMKAYQAAVTSPARHKENERIDFLVYEGHSMWGGTVTETLDRKNELLVEVDTADLAEFLEHERLSMIALVKIDVEGGEAEVLEGLIDHIRSGDRPAILIELVAADDPTWAGKLETVMALFELGYSVYRIERGGRLVRTAAEDLRDLNGVVNFVFATDQMVSERISIR